MTEWVYGRSDRRDWAQSLVSLLLHCVIFFFGLDWCSSFALWGEEDTFFLFVQPFCFFAFSFVVSRVFFFSLAVVVSCTMVYKKKKT